MTTRDIVVAGALPRHQVKQYLNALGLEFVEVFEEATLQSATIFGEPRFRTDRSTFHITDATEAQWGQIQDWVRKVTG